MQMNDALKRSLTDALASHLWANCLTPDWDVVAAEVMEFMYGEEDHPEPVDQCGDHLNDLSVHGRDSGGVSSLLGVVPSPEPHRCCQGFAYLGGPQSLTAEYVPAPRSCCAQTPLSPPGPAEEA